MFISLIRNEEISSGRFLLTSCLPQTKQRALISKLGSAREFRLRGTFAPAFTGLLVPDAVTLETTTKSLLINENPGAVKNYNGRKLYVAEEFPWQGLWISRTSDGSLEPVGGLPAGLAGEPSSGRRPSGV